MRKRRVVAFGHYGHRNFGDDLFQVVITARARDLWPRGKMRIFAPAPGFSNASNISGNISQLYLSPRRIGSAVRVLAAVSGVAWGQTIALCGGSTLRGLVGVQKLHARVARRRLRDFESLGLCIGRFVSIDEASEVECFISGFSRSIVRDAQLFRFPDRILQDRAVMGGDLGALYQYPPSRGADEDESIHLGIMQCASSEIDRQSYIESVRRKVGVLRSRTGRHVRVTVLALNNHPDFGDDALAFSLTVSLRGLGCGVNTVRHIELGIAETIEIIAGMDFALPTRLHGALVFYFCDTPFAFLEYEDKCSNFSIDTILPSVLQLNPASKAEAWVSAVQTMLDGAKPTMSPLTYRKRAEKAYVGDCCG
jgi:hypothetical protein